MVLITVTELIAESNLPDRDIDLSDYTTPQLQSKIDWATSYIQRESNRLFTDTEDIQTNDEPHSGSYTVCEDNTDIINIARDICMDIVFAKIDGSFDEDDDISSIKSGNSQISYSKSTKQKIDNRIAKIARNEIFLGII